MKDRIEAAAEVRRWWQALDAADREEVAVRAGTTYRYLYLIARGVRRPSPELATALEAATDGRLPAVTLLSMPRGQAVGAAGKAQSETVVPAQEG